jgi:5S rRNA maturation endonuclease (ribonuclease M5)
MPDWNLSIREQLRYKRIDWLMPSVDIRAILEKLDVGDISPIRGGEIRARCPDHALFVGRESSDPAWAINVDTGETFCFTEGRGSNLVWIVSRMLDCHPREAVKFLMQVDSEIAESTLQLAQNKKFRKRIVPSVFCGYGVEGEPIPAVRGLDAIRRDMEFPYMTPEAYDFFMYPPGKQPTLIRRETVDRYKVFFHTWGDYANRVIIPFVQKGDLVAFCAIDILGKDKWLAEHPLKKEKEYKKVMYPFNSIFAGGSLLPKPSGFLFGFDDCTRGCDILFLVEGAREKMKLLQEGFPDSVAILGGYLGEGQFSLITEIAPKRIALMFDGDKAGRLITDRVHDRLRRNYIDDKIIRCKVPNGKDPKNLQASDIQALI